jgi:hypothetical protein
MEGTQGTSILLARLRMAAFRCDEAEFRGNGDILKYRVLLL